MIILSNFIKIAQRESRNHLWLWNNMHHEDNFFIYLSEKKYLNKYIKKHLELIKISINTSEKQLNSETGIHPSKIHQLTYIYFFKFYKPSYFPPMCHWCKRVFG